MLTQMRREGVRRYTGTNEETDERTETCTPNSSATTQTHVEIMWSKAQMAEKLLSVTLNAKSNLRWQFKKSNNGMFCRKEMLTGKTLLVRAMFQ